MSKSMDNFVRSNLDADITDVSSTLSLARAATPYKNPPEATVDAPGLLVLQDRPSDATKIEIISYTNMTISGSSVILTGVSRGMENSTASAWVAGTPVFQGITMAVVNDKLDVHGNARTADFATIATTADFARTAEHAVTLQTPRSFTTSAGPVTWTPSADFDGSGNVTFATAIADAALSISKTRGLQSALDAKQATAGYTPANDDSVVHRSGNETITGQKTFASGVAAASFVSAHGDYGSQHGSISLQPHAGSTNGQVTVNSVGAMALVGPLTAPSGDFHDGLTAKSNCPASAGVAQGCSMPLMWSNEPLQVGAGGCMGLGFSKSKPFAYIRGTIENASGSHSGGLVLGTKPSTSNSMMVPALSITSAGAATFSSTVTAFDHINSSDKQLKHDITAFRARENLADLLTLCTWMWNKDDTPGIGIIAQAAQTICPEYVFVGDDGMLGIDKAGIALECTIGLACRVRELESGPSVRSST